VNFKKLLETLQRQRIAVVAVLIVGLAIYVVALPHLRKYSATSTLLAAAASSEQTSVLDPEKDPISSAVGIVDLEDLATSAMILDRVASQLHLSADDAKKLPGEVKAKSLFGSNILPVQVSDRDPNRAIRAANLLANELAAYTRSISTSRYDQLIADLTNQVADRRTRLQALDRRIQDVTSDNYYITPETGTTAINTRLVALESQAQLLAATVAGDVANAATFSKRPQLTRHLAGHEITTQDPSFVALKVQYGKDLAALNNMKAGYTENYAGIAGLQETVDRERASLARVEAEEVRDPTQSATYVTAQLDANRANATLGADRAQLAAVNKQIAELDGQLSSSGGQGTQIAELRRERAADDDAYGQLSARLSRAIADRSQAATIGSVVVIGRATSAPPALLGRPGVLGAAFAVAFIWLAITLAFVLDGADKRLRNTTSIEDLYGKPVFNPVG
jgi:capsular polysaccharide biosynthesis protein